jgi:predicted nucleic acid-binding protein
MGKPRVYVETTVVSYLAARLSSNPVLAGRQALTREWWDHRRAAFDLAISELVVDEAQSGDPEIAARRMKYLAGVPSLAVSPDAVSLADALVDQGPIPREYLEDALHIAVCAVNGIDFLVTWNCKHLANAALRDRIEDVVEDYGYRCPLICTPEELMEE